MTELEELRLAYAECSRQRNELLNKLKSQPEPVPVEWLEIVAVNLVREGVNKHKALFEKAMAALEEAQEDETRDGVFAHRQKIIDDLRASSKEISRSK